MSTVKYTKDHEWVRVDGDEAVVGITDYAQTQLGDVVYVELPEIGRRVDKGKEAAVVESVKAASEVYAPLSGEVTAVNDALADDPARGQHRSRWARAGSSSCALANAAELDDAARRGGLQEARRRVGLMRYLPLTDADRRAMLAAIGVASRRRSLSRRARRRAARARRSICRTGMGELEVERALARARGQEPAGRRRCRAFSAPAPIAITCPPRSITWSSAASS